MKKTLAICFATLFTIVSWSQTPCSGGSAGSYPCNGLTLQSYISSSTMGANEAQDSWGWTDPLDGKEYAIVALDNGTAFVNITDPINPIYLGRLNSHSGGSSLWRDVKTYGNYAYIVSEVNDDGVQVFDLTTLRGLTGSPVQNFTEDGFLFIGDSGGAGNDGRAHNIVINEDSGYAYVVGVNRSSNSNRGPIFIDLSDPLNPVEVGDYGLSDYFHDAQVVNYDGPDTDHTGVELMIGCNEDELVILDVSNKSNPIEISSISYSNNEYTHQGWFTEDKRFFIVGDELDEQNVGMKTRTLVFDMEDLDNPTLYYTHEGATNAIDHNGYVRGNRFYLANYSAGVRIFKIDKLYDPTLTDPMDVKMDEVNYFDTYPSNNSAAFNGVWNVYPYFESGNLVVSGFGNASVNGDGGLFILRDPNYDNLAPTVVCQDITATLNAATAEVTITAADLDGGSTDNIGITEMRINKTTFTCDDVGPNLVEFTVIDDYGNSSTCTATVTVRPRNTRYESGAWSNGTPDIGSFAKIKEDYNTGAPGNDSFTACKCNIDAGKTLTVTAGKYINIDQDINVNGTLIVEHEGSVVQKNSTAVTNNNGTINVRLTTPMLDSRDFILLGSPMTTEDRNIVWSSAHRVLKHNTANFVPNTAVTIAIPGAENFASETIANWENHTTGSLTPAEGYLLKPHTNSGASSQQFNYEYTQGTLNNGDISFDIVYNTPGPTATDNRNASPNILANPYPSAISAEDFINYNPMINEVYFWEHILDPSPIFPGSLNANFSMEDISMYNLSGGTKAGNDPGTSTKPNGYISTGQGFGVKASASGTAWFTNSMRRNDNNNTLRDQANRDRIWLRVSALEYDLQNTSLLAFSDATTADIDEGYDSKPLATILALYSHLENGDHKFGIQSREALFSGIKVPFGFASQVESETQYEISIEELEGENLTEYTVFLIDNETNSITNLSRENYRFRSSKGVFNNRFTVLFENIDELNTIQNPLESILVFPNPAQDHVYVQSKYTAITNVTIFDIHGRQIKSIATDNDVSPNIDISSLKSGFYLFELHTPNGTIVKKILKK